MTKVDDLMDDVPGRDIDAEIRAAQDAIRAIDERRDAEERERVAALVPDTEDQDDWEQPLPAPTDPLPPLVAGDVISFYLPMPLGVGTGWADSFKAIMTKRGMNVEITEGIIAASRNIDGWSWLELVDDVPGQIARWGSQGFQRGPWDEREPRVLRSSPEWDVLRENAYNAAWAIVNPQRRQEELAAVIAKYGTPTTQTQTRYAGDNGDMFNDAERSPR